MKTTIRRVGALPKNRRPTHPGEMLLREFLEPIGMSQAELARRLNIPPNRVNELIKGKRGITPNTAFRLAEFFDTAPQFWMNLQTACDLWDEQQSSKPATKAQRIQPYQHA